MTNPAYRVRARDDAAEAAFASYDFGYTVKDSGGWDYTNQDRRERIVYLEPGEEAPSLKAVLVIEFHPDSAAIKYCGATLNGQQIGRWPDELPPREEWFCWKTYVAASATDEVPAETTPRLLTPWSDPYEHEYPMDGLFVSPEEALTAKRELAPNENWVLCKLALEPVEVVPAEPEGAKRYLLMTTISQDVDGLRWGCDLALLCLDQPLMASLRRRIALLRVSFDRDAAIHEMSFWAPSQVVFYQQVAIDLMHLSSEEEDLLDRGAYVVLHRVDGPLAIEAQHERSVSLCRMTLSLTPTATRRESPSIVVAWTAFPSDSDTSVLTAEVPIELFGL